MARTSLIEYVEQYFARGGGTACAWRRGYRTVRWDYRRVAGVARQFARELEARGVAPGDRVMLWGENSGEWVAAFLGCVLRGAVVIPMDRVASPEFAARVARQVEAKLVVASRQAPALGASLPALVLEDLAGVVARHDAGPYRSPALTRRDPVQIIFTSGTTAEPKGVVITHGNVLANLEPLESEIAKYLKYERIFHPLRFLSLLPLSHVFGQFMGMWIPPLLGGVVIFQDALSPTEIIRAIKRERVSVLVAVPRMLESLKDKIERDLEAAGRLDGFRRELAAAEGEKFQWRMWRFRRIHRQFGWKFWAFISGGAALDAETEAFWSRLGFAVIQGYGMTETTSLVSVNHPFKLARGAIGKVLPGREIKLAENGEILVRGESIAAGYWNGRELKPVLGEEGWLRTGDVGALDAEGHLYFKGRKKNVIVTPAGMNVYPEDLEAALRRQPEVRDCVVVGLPVDGNAEPCAVLILEGEASAEAVVRRANEQLAEYQQMRRWLLWPGEDFPRTPTQKPKLNAIQEFARAQLGAAGGSATPPAGTLAELIARITGRAPENLRPDASLATDLNLSSIDRVELLSAIEDRLQVDLDESRFTATTTLGEVEQMLRRPPAEGPRFHYPRWPHHPLLAWIRSLVYYLLAWPATLVLCWPRVRGREHLAGVPRGPLLVVCNHIAFVDIGFVLFALPPRLRRNLAVAMEGEQLAALRDPPRGWNLLRRAWERLIYFLVVMLFRAFPLASRAGFRQSFAFMGELADRGSNLLVFPEGMRTRDGKLNVFRAGIGLLVNNLNVPVVPMRIDGLFPLKVARRWYARPGTVRVSIGEPVRFAPGTDPDQITRELHARVAALEWQ
jgi:long-chain acyl-CoA synthetase